MTRCIDGTIIKGETPEEESRIRDVYNKAYLQHLNEFAKKSKLFQTTLTRLKEDVQLNYDCEVI